MRRGLLREVGPKNVRDTMKINLVSTRHLVMVREKLRAHKHDIASNAGLQECARKVALFYGWPQPKSPEQQSRMIFRFLREEQVVRDGLPEFRPLRYDVRMREALGRAAAWHGKST